MIPENTFSILLGAGYEESDFVLIRNGPNLQLDWHSTDPRPTDQQINDWGDDTVPLPSGQLFSEWLASHGGDPISTAKRQILERLNDNADLTRAGFQALIILLLDNLQSAAWKTGKILYIA